MPSKEDKTSKAYHFFKEAVGKNQIFSFKDIADATGWSISSVRTYKAKKWHGLLEKVDDGYRCRNPFNLSEESFHRLHTQRTDLEGEILRPRFSPTVDTLIDKCRESALLGVQIYNNPLISFRTPGYVVQMVIAYTALFHAIFERDNRAYWYTNSDGTPTLIDGDKYAWDISECIKQYFSGRTRPEIENLKFFIEIRNKIEHRFVPELDLTLSGKCQALLMNFEELLVSEFGQYFALGSNLALALQFSTYSNEQEAVLRRIQSDEYEYIKAYSDAYDAKLTADIAESPKYSFRAFLIPKIGNHANSSDVAIEFIRYDPDNPEEMEKYEKQVAFIREKKVQVANQGKLKPKSVVLEVSRITGKDFKMHHHTNAWKLYKVRPQESIPTGCNVKYCQFDDAFNQFVYTDEWVKFLCEKVNDPDEFSVIKGYQNIPRKMVSTS